MTPHTIKLLKKFLESLSSSRDVMLGLVPDDKVIVTTERTGTIRVIRGDDGAEIISRLAETIEQVIAEEAASGLFQVPDTTRRSAEIRSRENATA